MDKDSTFRLLNIISTLDNRIVTEAMAESWATVLSGTTFEDAMERVGNFFRSGITRRLTVQDVVTPDVQPEDNAWMDRSSHSKPLPHVRYEQLIQSGHDRVQALVHMQGEGYELTPSERDFVYPEGRGGKQKWPNE
jgi:hypothetical protein